MESSRKEYMDVARGLGMLAVIYGHIDFGVPGIILYTFHLPLFFIISGYFFHYEGDFGAFLKGKVRSYLIPYVFAAFVISLFEAWRRNWVKGAISFQLQQFAIQNRYSTLWFLATLFVAMIFFWWIVRICQGQFKKIFLMTIVLASIGCIYDTITHQGLPWNVDTAFVVLFYLAFGYWLRRASVIEKIQQAGKLGRKILGFFLLDFGLTVLNLMITDTTYEMYWCKYGIFPVTIAAACAGSMMVILIAMKLEHVKWLKWIGKNTMVFFAFHQAIAIEIMLDQCHKMLFLKQMIVNHQYLLKAVTENMIVFVGTIIICFIIHQIIMLCHGGRLIGKK